MKHVCSVWCLSHRPRLLLPPFYTQLQGSAETGESSYSSLVGRVLGPAGEALLQAALFGFCFGVMAVYLVVCGDVLAGA